MKKWIHCPVCKKNKWEYYFKVQDHRLNKCTNCGCMAINPQPSIEELKKIYSADYFLADQKDKNKANAAVLKKLTAQAYIKEILRYIGNTKSKEMLEIGCGNGEFLEVAQDHGFDVLGIDIGNDFINKISKKQNLQGKVIAGTVEQIQGKKFDVIVFSDVIEHTQNPIIFLSHVYRLCKNGGFVFCATPSLDSLSSKLQGSKWVEFKTEHLFYFNSRTLTKLFYDNGFNFIILKKIPKILNLEYIIAHFRKYKTGDLFEKLALLLDLAPTYLKKIQFPVVASGVCLLGKKYAKKRTTVSIIIPVFNEINTFQALFDQVISKKIHNVELEIIIVESNSSDGTKEIVQKIRDPRVKKIFQKKPEGKGFAVRAGLKKASGDIVIIQDADLEYDIDDYDSLIHHILDCDACFVLGTRHSGKRWKIRHFKGQPLWAFIANCVHWGLTGLINILYGVRLTDPFTMYKVFRKSIIQDITFETKRFDFDYELLLKLIRKGYKPLEIPVNYSARSFAEGKKVSIRNDPISWLVAIFKYRFINI